MPLFFFLSGVFFCRSFSKKGGVKLVFSKVDTVFYPYVIWSLLQGGIEVYLSNYTNGSVSLVEVFSLLWLPRAQFWFLYTLFAIFALSSIVFSLISKRLTILVLACSVILYLNPTYLPESFIFLGIPSNFVFFIFGIAYKIYVKTGEVYSRGILLGCALLFILSQWFFHGYLSYNYTDKGLESLLLAVISIAFVVSISFYLTRINCKWFAYIGYASMAIYLMHILASSGSRVILSKGFGIDSLIIHLVVGCLLGIVAPLFALLVINKLNIKYLLSAPVSQWATNSYKKLLRCPR